MIQSYKILDSQVPRVIFLSYVRQIHTVCHFVCFFFLVLIAGGIIDFDLMPTKSIHESDASSIVSEPISNVNRKKKPAIPDGGYGWMVVFASLAIQLIIDGIAFSFGLIYTELLNYFGESKTKTAWIGALFIAVPLLSGPVLSNLVDKYGCRVMTVIGGLIGGIGFVLASISTSVEMLYITFGLISGFGIGIGYVTAIVSIAFWFDKRRK